MWEAREKREKHGHRAKGEAWATTSRRQVLKNDEAEKGYVKNTETSASHGNRQSTQGSHAVP